MTPALPIVGDYADTWPAISQAAKEAAGWRCVRCRHPFDSSTGRALACRDPFEMPRELEGDPILWACDERRCRHKLIMGRAGATATSHNYGVHHFDGDKGNNQWWNLMALCNSCHLYVQASVIPERAFMFHHSPWMVPYVCGYYAWDRRKLLISRAEAAARPEEYLALGQPWLYADTEFNQPMPI